MTQAALPLLRASANPVIVHVAPGLSWPRFLLEHPNAQQVFAVPYPASKPAVITITVQNARSLPDFRINVPDPGHAAAYLNEHTGHQTVTEGTDVAVKLALVGRDGPTGELWNRDSRIDY